MIPICRRNFLSRCGLAATGGLLLAPLASLEAATAPAHLMSGSDRALLRLLQAYSGDVYFWGGNVFARATGLARESGATHLLVLVKDYPALYGFLGSSTLKSLGKVFASGNTLSFTFHGTPYSITNNSPAEFGGIVAGMSGPTVRDAETLAVFAHQNVLYHPATDTVIDPYLALKKRSVELVRTPAGGLKSQFETLVQGWLEAKKSGLPLGKSFDEFQSALLASETTPQAADRIARAWMENIAALAAVYDVASLRPLLLSPLVSSSLQSIFHLDAEAAADEVQKLRAAQPATEVSDASIWLAVLLAPEIKDGTASEWTGNDDDDDDAASQAALAVARQLVGTPGFEAR